ncbi:MAG TPA: ParB/RepB/Spo0J family partition protein [Gryllotalpicola sp.]
MTDNVTEIKPRARRGRPTMPDMQVDSQASVVDALTTPATGPRLELVPIDRLVVDDETNVRKQLRIDADDLVASIAAHGVLQPPVVYPDPINDGRYRVEIGHRRTVAARQAGLTEIHVLVVDAQDAADRIGRQLDENRARTGLTDSEELAAVHQLALFGLPAEEIGKKTRRDTTTVEQALKVTQSPAATQAFEQREQAGQPITLEDAAVYAEFEGDDEALAKLSRAQPHLRAARVADEIRHERAVAAALAEARDKLPDGVTILDGAPNWDSKTVQKVSSLHVDEERTKRLTLAIAKKQAGDDLRAWLAVNGSYGTPTVTVEYGVANWTAHGWHAPAYIKAGRHLTEAEKADRKQMKANKAEWGPASIKRQEWITTQLLQRKKLPDDAIRLIAHRIIRNHQITPYEETGSGDLHKAADLLGLPHRELSWGGDTPGNIQQHLIERPDRALHVALAMALGAYEYRFGLVRDPQYARDSRAAGYLTTLQQWGYQLDPVEQRLVETHTPAEPTLDDIDEEAAS